MGTPTDYLVDAKQERPHQHHSGHGGVEVLHQVSHHNAEGDTNAIDDEIGDEGGEHHQPPPASVRWHRHKGLRVRLRSNHLLS